MSSRALILAALVLLCGAGVAAYWGVAQRGSMTPQAAAPLAPSTIHETLAAAPEQESVVTQVSTQLMEEVRSPVVVLARAVTAHDALSAADLAVEYLRIAPPGSFNNPSELLGKTLWRDLPAGTLLNHGSFEGGGPLARMIRADERAFTLASDDLVSAGGHLRPGDYVDALLYLAQDDKNGDRTVQVVVPALRVLSVGAALGLSAAGEPLAAALDADNTTARPGTAPRTVVLALPQSLLTRFALAVQVGRMSLAVRSAEEELLGHYLADDRPALESLNQQLFQFEKLALANAPRPQEGLVAPPPPPSGVLVHRGSAVSLDTP